MTLFFPSWMWGCRNDVVDKVSYATRNIFLVVDTWQSGRNCCGRG